MNSVHDLVILLLIDQAALLLALQMVLVYVKWGSFSRSDNKSHKNISNYGIKSLEGFIV